MSPALRIATRPSPLALAQTRLVADLLAADTALVEVANQTGPGDKERFVRGVEQAVLSGGAELGVHSAKDLPGEMEGGLVIAAVPPRADVRDAWIGPGGSLEEIPEGARVGTSSLRRRAQLLALRPDLVPVPMNGNVDTRIAKLRAGECDGLVLAMAGLERLGRADEASFAFDPDRMTPAAGQGALVVQGRTNGPGLEEAGAIGDEDSERALTAERAAVVAIGADCDSSVGFHARLLEGQLTIDGFAGLADGSAWLRDRVEGDPSRPAELGRELAGRMLAAGADALLAGTLDA
ncbi:MAG: hydroxymethylbilane synthase [Solirubrobacterales bacterium]|nr:hydroxymethylbilane synthase [Solirubrobacterales bacterium]